MPSPRCLTNKGVRHLFSSALSTTLMLHGKSVPCRMGRVVLGHTGQKAFLLPHEGLVKVSSSLNLANYIQPDAAKEPSNSRGVCRSGSHLLGLLRQRRCPLASRQPSCRPRASCGVQSWTARLWAPWLPPCWPRLSLAWGMQTAMACTCTPPAQQTHGSGHTAMQIIHYSSTHARAFTAANTSL